MQIQINTDHHIQGRESLAAWFTSTVESALARQMGRGRILCGTGQDPK